LKYLITLVLVMGMLGTALVAYRLDKINAFIWLSDYTFNSPTMGDIEGVVDIVFFMPDHWEPGNNQDILNAWMTDYRALAEKHIDADGYKLKHDWYYPIDQFHSQEVESLVVLCSEGLGDIGVQLHHRDDTPESVRRKYSDGIDSLQTYGALITEDGVCRFSFVHGNWALDNSRLEHGRNFCGVNNEMEILMDLGCFADVTFPSMTQLSQPKAVNKLFYARDDENPKSYDNWTRSSTSYKPGPDELAFLCGPMMIDWTDWRFKTHPTIEDGCLYYEIPTTLHRFEVWLKAWIHVEGQPNWVFVRPFTHGATLKGDGFDNILGKNIDQMLTDVEAKYNDGKKYRIHYMTTREAYNVMKAAEAGHNGNPNDYRDFMIQPYLYQPKTLQKEAS
ncbi:MAG: hypothetical protein KKA42_11030, partial [candidate division Zixibacteria bacterium]|nr:hypothetical protein [candidate division Zixibacteria bacterium]